MHVDLFEQATLGVMLSNLSFRLIRDGDAIDGPVASVRREGNGIVFTSPFNATVRVLWWDASDHGQAFKQRVRIDDAYRIYALRCIENAGLLIEAPQPGQLAN